MTHFRFHYRQQDEHTHIRMFVGGVNDSPPYPHYPCGDLVMRNIEWASFRNKLPSSASVEYILDKE